VSDSFRSRLPEVLRKFEGDILGKWTEALLAGRKGAISETELKDQCRGFLSAFRDAASRGGIADISSPEWKTVQDGLADISRSRAKQGFAPSETANFILSLKQPLFNRLREECGRDADALAHEVWAATHLLDKLALHTVEVFQKEREEFIVKNQLQEFVATLAHELRNPLAPIRNVLTILNKSKTDPEQQKLHQILERQVSHLTRMVDDLTDASRIERRKLQLKKERIEIRAVVTSAVHACETVIRAHGHQIDTILPEGDIYLLADPVRVEQILRNLINNSAKYSNDGARITVTLQQSARGIICSVKDNGMGISPEMLPHIFEMFTQAKQTLDRPAGGLGIGLALTKHLVELHGGRIEARSDGPGTGAEFIVRLPKGDADIEASRTTANGDWQTTQLLRVLVVEDSPDTRETLECLLRMLGHQVESASNGPEGISRAGAFKPDVTIVDVGLPGMDGYEVARTLRVEYGDSLFLIALTGYSQPEARTRSLEAGFDRHLVKPIDIEQLVRVLNQITPQKAKNDDGRH